ncbi:Trafficking protein particle complex subunit 11 [Hondaea fermentalgiana]|uniref:Trafficking protein particle complex subunit 11 n=1 Tax=Hondaea fermentalgiana TaxID=2315210 RepID=A0A2R5GD27_9STRA|nr:Trafficking protein particle complex subunit 11 [Hondaea fermentalgiana]|eukprot:GBG27628.1 Trafficking protein particle complex subunit 11 [Hondaea fermentalgiana]
MRGAALRPLVAVVQADAEKTGPGAERAATTRHAAGAAGKDGAVVAAGLRHGLTETLRATGVVLRPASRALDAAGENSGPKQGDHDGDPAAGALHPGEKNHEGASASDDNSNDDSGGFVVHERSMRFAYPTKKDAAMQPQVRLQEMQRGVDADTLQQQQQQQQFSGGTGGKPLAGIFSTAWMDKHQGLIPSCVLLVCQANAPDREIGDKVAELRRGLNQYASFVRIIVILFAESDVPSQLEVPHKLEQVQQRTSALARELKLSQNCVVVVNSADAAEAPLVSLARIVRKESAAYYTAKGLRAQQHLLHLGQQQHGSRTRSVEAYYAATARYNLKMARLYEATFTFEKALKHHELAYLACIELASRKSSNRPTQMQTEELLVHAPGTYPVMEIKAVAEIVHIRLCRLRLSSSQSTKAILMQFDRHMRTFRALEGPASLIFQHWEWLANQHVGFSGLIYELGTAVSLSGLSAFDRARCSVAYHTRLASRFAIRRREAAEALGVAGPSAANAQQLREQLDSLTSQHNARVESSQFMGAYPVVTSMQSNASIEASVSNSLTQCAIYLEEAKCDQGALALHLLRRVLALSTETNKDARSVRLIAGIRACIGRELVQRGAIGLAMQDLLHAVVAFNRDQWFALAEPVLFDIVDSAAKLSPGDADFDIDAVSERRKVMHSALRLLSMRAVPPARKAAVAQQFHTWLATPVRRAKDGNTPDGARLKLGFTLDDLEDSPIQWSAYFDRHEAAVGDTVELVVRIRSTFHIETRFQTLSMIFNDSRYEVPLTEGQREVRFAANTEQTFKVPVHLLDLENSKPRSSSADAGDMTSLARHRQGGLLASPSRRGVPLTPVRLQLKLVAEESATMEPPAGFAMFSGVSLWSSAREAANDPLHSSDTVLNLITASPNLNGTSRISLSSAMHGARSHGASQQQSSTPARPSRSLVIRPFESSLEIRLEHTGFALIGEMFELEAHLSAGEESIRDGKLWVTCDPPLQSKSTPLDYVLPNARTCVQANKTFEIPCCLPFESQVKLIPRNPQLPSALGVNAPCTVDLDLVCPQEPLAVDRIEVVDVRVEPSKMCTVASESTSPTRRLDETPGASNVSTSVLPAPVAMHGGERLSLGFEVSTSSMGDNTTLGYVAVLWRRQEGRPEMTMHIPLPKLRVEHTQFFFTLSTFPSEDKRVGESMLAVLDIQNASGMAQELELSVSRNSSFYIAGSYSTTLLLGPTQSTKFKLNLVPLVSGNVQLPTITVGSKRFADKYTVPSPTEAMIFVAPSQTLPTHS